MLRPKASLPASCGPGATGRRGIAAPLLLALAALAFGLRFPAPAYAQSPLIQGWLAANTACKGGASDNPKTQKACARRDELGEKLKHRRCEYQSDGDWWRCAR